MDKKITRKEAIKKAGVSALAASSLVLLQSKANAAGSAIISDSGDGLKPYGDDNGNGVAGGNGVDLDAKQAPGQTKK